MESYLLRQLENSRNLLLQSTHVIRHADYSIPELGNADSVCKQCLMLAFVKNSALALLTQV